RQFPPVNRTEGLLSLGNANTAITPVVVERFYRYGQSVASQVFAPGRRGYFMPCTPASATGSDDQCARPFIPPIGRHLYRRALSDAELAGLVGLAGDAASRLGDFHDGLAYVLAAMMASPELGFIWDNVEEDPARPGECRLDGYSKASRLSCFLWNSPPDGLVRRAADQGERDGREGLEASVARMLATARVDVAIRGLFADMLRFDELETLAQATVIYPACGPGVTRDAAEQMLRTIVDHLVTLE